MTKMMMPTSRHRHSLTPDKRSPGHLSSLQDSVYLDDYDDDDHHDDVDDKDDDAKPPHVIYTV